MSQNSSRPLSKFNLVLTLLWLVDVVVTAAGYLILTSSNATQAEFYTSQSADYVTYFTAQSGSGLGATLMGAGILGFIITLAAMVVTRSITHTAAYGAPVAAVNDEPDFDFDDDDTDFDTDEKAAVQASRSMTNAAPATTPATATDTVEAPAAPSTAAQADDDTTDDSTDGTIDEPKTAR